MVERTRHARNRVKSGLAALVLCAGALIGTPTSDAAGPLPSAVTKITDGADGPSGGRSPGEVAVSNDGRYITFRSAATNLTADADNGFTDIFLHDRTLDETFNLTAQADGNSGNPAISADGSTIVFASFAANLTADIDTTGHRDIFSYDVASGAITRITGPATTSSSGGYLDVSGDGSIVTFTSAHNFAGTPSGYSKLFMTKGGVFRHLTEGLTGNAYFGTVAADGSMVAFSVFSGSLKMYVFDVATGVATLTTPPGGSGGYASPSDDGRTLLVASTDPLTGSSLLWKLDRSLPSNPAWTVLDGGPGIDAFNGTLSGNGTYAYYLRDVGPTGTAEPNRFEMATSTMVAFLPHAVEAWDFGSSADGAVVAFTAADYAGDPIRDIYVVEAEQRCLGKAVTINMNQPGVSGFGTGGGDVILGTPGDDTINGLGGNDTICSGDGADTVFAGAGDDNVLAGAGDDVVFGATGADQIDGGDGDDLLVGQGGGDRIHGRSGNDKIKGMAGNDNIYGGLGDDKLFGNSGVDRLWGGGGVDQLSGGARGDYLFGEGSRDILHGDGGPDLLDGGDGDDDLFGGMNVDTLTGGPGTDSFDGGPAADVCTDTTLGEPVVSCP